MLWHVKNDVCAGEGGLVGGIEPVAWTAFALLDPTHKFQGVPSECMRRLN